MEPDGKLPAAAAAAATHAPEAAIGRTGTFFVFITGADAGDQESVLCTEERDWQNLLPEILTKVSEFALRSDVTDYIRLRAVCNPWRSAAIADPQLMGMVPRYFPRNWDMMKGDTRGDKTRFVNAVTDASIWLQIPPEYGEVLASAEGCLILGGLGCRCEQKLRLFNPVTRAVSYLPAVPCGIKVEAAGFIYDGEDDADLTVALCACAGDHEKLIVQAKPGEDMPWRIVDDDEEGGEVVPYSVGGLSVRGRFYVPTPAGDVRKLELLPEPHLVYVARQEARHRHGSGFGVRSALEQDVDVDDGLVLMRLIPGNAVEVFCVNFTDGGMGSLSLVEDQKDLDSCLLPWLRLVNKSSD
uniref:Uncharacterized protein n=1 Tax=Avena sativa TaxID=4498 RepID=A0ACD5UH52_AVESA